MKKLLTMLMLAMCVFALPSCSDDDKDEPTQKDDPATSSSYKSLIVGEWSDGDLVEEAVWVFKADGQGYWQYYDKKYNRPVITDDVFEYKISGTKLTVDYHDDNPEIFTIIALDENQLIVKDDECDDIDTYSRR